MFSTPIEENGLVLREFRRSDLPAFKEISERQLEAGIPDRDRINNAEELVRLGIGSQIQTPDPNKRKNISMVVTESTDINQPVGFVSLVEGAEGRRDLGYVIDPIHQGKGYATKASRILLSNYLKSSANAGEISANVHSKNEASIRVLTKLGFTPKSKHLKVDNLPKDDFSFGLVLSQKDFKKACENEGTNAKETTSNKPEEPSYPKNRTYIRTVDFNHYNQGF